MYSKKFQLALTILLLSASALFITTVADAQNVNVHVLLVIMDADRSIGDSMELDQQLLEKTLKVVELAYPVHKTVYRSSRAQAQSDAVLRWIRNVRPGANDVVWVCYTGHGGMVSNTDRRTFLNLTDRRLYRSELEDAMRQVSCRLKLLITDACSSAPEPPQTAKTTVYAVQTVGKRHIKNLFGEHEGFLHLNGATEGEYGWCHPSIGGSTFIVALMDRISEDSDTNNDGFVSWSEVVAMSANETQKLFDRIYPSFSDSTKADLRARGIKGQTVRKYSIPQRGSSQHNFEDSLWELENRSSRFDAEIRPDRTGYQIAEYLTLQLTTEEDCYITVLNWDNTGSLTVLLPNGYHEDNYLRAGQRLTLPPPHGDYNFRLSGPAGKERIKIIAVSTQAANRGLQNALGKGHRESGGAFVVKAIDVEGAHGIRERDDTESRLMDELEKLNPADWSVSSTSVRVRN